MDSHYTPTASSYQISGLSNPDMPPPPPPKHATHAIGQRETPEGGPPLPPPPPPPHDSRQPLPSHASQHNHQHVRDESLSYSVQTAPPGDGWLPDILKDKSKTDLSHVLSNPALQAALINAPSTTYPSLPQSQQPIHTALHQNIALATHLVSLESQLDVQRASVQSQLLSLHALERQWRQKQAEMDTALSPFSPKSLYQRLAQAVQEQEQVCQALEESFLEGEGRAGEREVGDFVKRYREGRKLMLLRRERKERWDEGRVGGWR